MNKHPQTQSRLSRYPDSGVVAGVCAGLADFLGWSVRLIRVLAVLTFIFGGVFPIVLVYGLAWYLMPKQPGRPDRIDDHRSRASGGGASRSDVQARFARLEQRLGSMEECVTSGDYDLRRELRKLEN